MRYFIRLSFNGEKFSGWQTQKNAISIQDVLENTFKTFFGYEIPITGCGRTDAGVHAREYFAHFDLPDTEKISPLHIYKLNAILPSQIVIHDIFSISEDFHARFSAKSREYRYFIYQEKNPFLNSLATYYPYQLDIEKMNKAAKLLLGKKSFTSFAKLHSQTKTDICHLMETEWSYTDSIFSNGNANNNENNLLVFRIKADRFLRNMVRSIVGTLLEIGSGKRPVEWILQVLEQQDRRAAGTSVPAKGLYLWSITYDF